MCMHMLVCANKKWVPNAISEVTAEATLDWLTRWDYSLLKAHPDPTHMPDLSEWNIPVEQLYCWRVVDNRIIGKSNDDLTWLQSDRLNWGGKMRSLAHPASVEDSQHGSVVSMASMGLCACCCSIWAAHHEAIQRSSGLLSPAVVPLARRWKSVWSSKDILSQTTADPLWGQSCWQQAAGSRQQELLMATCFCVWDGFETCFFVCPTCSVETCRYLWWQHCTKCPIEFWCSPVNADQAAGC